MGMTAPSTLLADFMEPLQPPVGISLEPPQGGPPAGNKAPAVFLSAKQQQLSRRTSGVSGREHAQGRFRETLMYLKSQVELGHG
jgi:hypothetical protein